MRLRATALWHCEERADAASVSATKQSFLSFQIASLRSQ